ncbi:oligosaccharide flippase family protein [bacterium]|nr:oligosaccharide flippase family protein [bacterium]
MNLSRKIFSNTFWQVFGRLVTALVGVISIKLITNSMTTSAYGMYTTLFELVGFFAIMADFGLYTICVQQMAEKKHSQEKILANVLSIRLVLIVVTLGLASIAIPLIPKYADTLIAKNVALVSLTTSFALAAGTISSLLQYRLKMIWFSVAQILGKIVTVTGIFFVIKASMFS